MPFDKFVDMETLSEERRRALQQSLESMGGLAVATVLTLISLPSLYITWFKIREDGERTTATGASAPPLASVADLREIPQSAATH